MFPLRSSRLSRTGIVHLNRKPLYPLRAFCWHSWIGEGWCHPPENPESEIDDATLLVGTIHQLIRIPLIVSSRVLKHMKKLFTNNGQLSFLSHLGLFFLGSLLIGLALFYSQSNLTFLLGTIGGILLIGFAGVAWRSRERAIAFIYSVHYSLFHG